MGYANIAFFSRLSALTMDKKKRKRLPSQAKRFRKCVFRVLYPLPYDKITKCY